MCFEGPTEELSSQRNAEAQGQCLCQPQQGAAHCGQIKVENSLKSAREKEKEEPGLLPWENECQRG